jgi:hypothetical protein
VRQATERYDPCRLRWFTAVNLLGALLRRYVITTLAMMLSWPIAVCRRVTGTIQVSPSVAEECIRERRLIRLRDGWRVCLAVLHPANSSTDSRPLTTYQ